MGCAHACAQGMWGWRASWMPLTWRRAWRPAAPLLTPPQRCSWARAAARRCVCRSRCCDFMRLRCSALRSGLHPCITLQLLCQLTRSLDHAAKATLNQGITLIPAGGSVELLTMLQRTPLLRLHSDAMQVDIYSFGVVLWVSTSSSLPVPCMFEYARSEHISGCTPVCLTVAAGYP